MSWMRSFGCQPSGIHPVQRRPLGDHPWFGRCVVAQTCAARRRPRPPSAAAGAAAGPIRPARGRKPRARRAARRQPARTGVSDRSADWCAARPRHLPAAPRRRPPAHRRASARGWRAPAACPAPTSWGCSGRVPCVERPHSASSPGGRAGHASAPRGRAKTWAAHVAVFKGRELVDHLSVTPQVCRQGVGGDQPNRPARVARRAADTIPVQGNPPDGREMLELVLPRTEQELVEARRRVRRGGRGIGLTQAASGAASSRCNKSKRNTPSSLTSSSAVSAAATGPTQRRLVRAPPSSTGSTDSAPRAYCTEGRVTWRPLRTRWRTWRNAGQAPSWAPGRSPSAREAGDREPS